MSAPAMLLRVAAGTALLGLIVVLFLALGSERRREEAPRVEDGPAGVELVLADGRRVAFPEAPHRILPTNASIVDLLVELLPPERFAGLPEQAFTWSRLADDPGGFEKHPVFFRYVAETVLELAPDLVIASSFNSPDTHARLGERGIPVLKLDVRDSMAEVHATLRMLGRLLRVSDRAEAAVAALEERARRLEERCAGRGGLRVLSYSNLGTGGWGSGADTTMHEVIRLAGMSNAGAEEGRRGVLELDFETLLAIDPDVIVTGGDEDGGATAARLRGEPALSTLRAVRRGAIVALPPRLAAASSQEMLSAAERLADGLDAMIAAGRVDPPRSKERGGAGEGGR